MTFSISVPMACAVDWNILNIKSPLLAHAVEYLVYSWWSCLGRLETFRSGDWLESEYVGGMAVRVTKCPFVVWTPLLHGVHHTKSSCCSLLHLWTELSVMLSTP